MCLGETDDDLRSEFPGGMHVKWPFREVLFRGPFAALSKPKSHMEEFYPPSIQMDPELCGTSTSGKQRDCHCTFGPVVSGHYTLHKGCTLHVLGRLPGGSTIAPGRDFSGELQQILGSSMLGTPFQLLARTCHISDAAR